MDGKKSETAKKTTSYVTINVAIICREKMLKKEGVERGGELSNSALRDGRAFLARRSSF